MKAEYRLRELAKKGNKGANAVVDNLDRREPKQNGKPGKLTIEQRLDRIEKTLGIK